MDCIIPGSFDPITNGHVNLIKKASMIFDNVWVVIFINPDKKRMFDNLREVRDNIQKIFKDFSNIKVDCDSKLVTDYAAQYPDTCIVRGIRNVKDYVYEEDLANIYTELNPNIPIVWLRPDANVSFLSSSMVRELIKRNKPFDKYIPEEVLKYIKEKRTQYE